MPADYSHLRNLRLAELKSALRFLPRDRPIMELGAGAGWQSGELHRLGWKVTALDVPSERYAALHAARVCPVKNFDGAHIPFPSGSYYCIYSCHTLAHVQELRTLYEEMIRVLVPGSRCVHIVPTSSWRFWTILGWYADRARKLARRLIVGREIEPAQSAPAPRPPRRALRRCLFPAALGVRGTALGELFTFSHAGWRRHFHLNGFQVVYTGRLRLFYTGNGFFGPRLPLHIRQRLALVLGSSSAIYVVRPRAHLLPTP